MNNALGQLNLAACTAHARRKFFDVHEATKSPMARKTLHRIAVLYRIQDAIRGRPPAQRLRIRTEHTAPIFARSLNASPTTR